LRCQRGAILKMGAGLVNHFPFNLLKFSKINVYAELSRYHLIYKLNRECWIDFRTALIQCVAAVAIQLYDVQQSRW